MSVEISKLPSGLTVITDTMPHLETAALGVWAGVGGRDEKPNEHGISHLLEHMAFKGTTRRNAREIVEEIEAVGGDLNAGTSTETTAYYARVMKADVPLALDVLADILAKGPVVLYFFPAAFSVGSHMLDWKLGLLNTCVLLFSSYTAAQSVRYAQLGDKKMVGNMMLITMACAAIFMVIKAFEYHHKWHLGTLPGHFFNLTHHGHEAVAEACAISHIGDFEPYHLRSYFGIYFIMTGVHGLHVLIGIGIYIWMYIRNSRGEFTEKFFTPVDLTALYWHLVDLIWIFLFPLVYLID